MPKSYILLLNTAARFQERDILTRQTVEKFCRKLCLVSEHICSLLNNIYLIKYVIAYFQKFDVLCLKFQFRVRHNTMTAAYNRIMYTFGCEITASSSNNFVKAHRKPFTNLVAHSYECDVVPVSDIGSKNTSLSMSFLVVDVL